MTTERIEAFWQPATADDVARVMAGETVEARFRDFEKDEWKIAVLSGWSKFNERDRLPWVTRGGLCYMFCQVYREPSWWTKRPDPGPGWKLLGKLPDEELKPGDQAWDLWDDKQWSESENANSGGHQVFGVWYRRRIEAEPKTVKLDEGSKCPMQGCSGALRFRPVKDCACHIRPPCSHCADNPPCCPVCEWTSGDPIEPALPEPQHYVLRVGDSASLPNGQTITITKKGFEVTQ